MTLTSFFALAMRRRMGFRDLRVLGESVSADGYAQAKDVLRIVVGLAACFEGAGILLLMLAFVPQFGLQASGSASLPPFRPSAMQALTCLVSLGPIPPGALCPQLLCPGRGHVYDHCRRPGLYGVGGADPVPKKRKLSLHARVVLIFSVLLWVGGAALIGLLEWNNPASMGNLSAGDKIMRRCSSRCPPARLA